MSFTESVNLSTFDGSTWAGNIYTWSFGALTLFWSNSAIGHNSNETWWEHSNALERFKTTKIIGYDKLGG